MNTAEIRYEGDLRVGATHVRSGQSILSDAPVDNNGKGEAFSPTDLVATALANCMLTVMGIKARTWNKDLRKAKATVLKHMGNGPRRIVQVDVTITLEDIYTKEERHILEKTAYACPVAKSLHPDVKQHISIVWT